VSNRHLRRLTLVLTALAATTSAQLAFAAGLQQTAVKDDTTLQELGSAASDAYFAWNQNSAAKPNQFNVFAEPMPVGGPRFKVNAPKSQGYMGGIDGTTLVYAQRKSTGQNLWLFDLVAKTRTILPPKVNTTHHEWRPTISGDWIQFGRITPARSRVYLYNRVTQALILLDEINLNPQGTAFLEPGQMSGNWATWTRVGGHGGARVKVYDIANASTATIPLSVGTVQFGAAATPSGAIYYGEEDTLQCGSNAELLKWVPGSPPTSLVRLNRGVDFALTYAAPLVGSDDVYFAKGRCTSSNVDIFKVNVS